MAAQIVSLQEFGSTEAITAEYRRVLEATVTEQDALLALERKKSELQLRLHQMQHLIADLRGLDAQQEHLRRLGSRLQETLPLAYQAIGALQEQRRRGEDTTAIAASLARLMDAIPKITTTSPALPPTPNLPLLSSLVAPFFEGRQLDGTSHQVVGQEQNTVRRFLESAGDRPVDAYERSDVTAFLKQLRQLPASYGKAPADRNLPLAVLIERANATNAARLSDKTCKRHLSTLAQLLQYAVQNTKFLLAAKQELVGSHRFRISKRAGTSGRHGTLPTSRCFSIVQSGQAANRTADRRLAQRSSATVVSGCPS